MSRIVYTSKRLAELLESMSMDQKNFKTRPHGTRTRSRFPGDYQYTRNGYLHITGAYGGHKLIYVLPYSTGNVDVTSGFVPGRELAAWLHTRGADSLRLTYKYLEKKWKPVMLERWRDRAD